MRMAELASLPLTMRGLAMTRPAATVDCKNLRLPMRIFDFWLTVFELSCYLAGRLVRLKALDTFTSDRLLFEIISMLSPVTRGGKLLPKPVAIAESQLLLVRNEASSQAESAVLNLLDSISSPPLPAN